METSELLDKAIGTIESKSLEAKPVVVAGFVKDDITGKKGSKNEGNVVGQKLSILCKHPDQEDPIKLSSAKFIKGTSVKVDSLWINLDEEENLQKGSTISELLSYYEVATIKELEGKELKTDYQSETNKYLCFKCY